METIATPDVLRKGNSNKRKVNKELETQIIARVQHILNLNPDVDESLYFTKEEIGHETLRKLLKEMFPNEYHKKFIMCQVDAKRSKEQGIKQGCYILKK